MKWMITKGYQDACPLRRRVNAIEEWIANGTLFKGDANAELAAMCALAGRIITVAEYMGQIKLVNAQSAEVYRYMNFDQIKDFVDVAATVEM